MLALFSVRNEDYHLEYHSCTFTPISGISLILNMMVSVWLSFGYAM